MSSPPSSTSEQSIIQLSTKASSIENSIQGRISTVKPIETDLVSSLIEFELQNDDDHSDNDIPLMTTARFGDLWVHYSVEEKRRFECSATDCNKLAKRLSKTWNIDVIEVIGQEFIAVEDRTDPTPSVLLHIALQPRSQFKMTMKAKHHVREIYHFLSKRQLT
ncbi:MAG: hypothetical protein EXX96DRAFT_556023 [Benjaminiella poitrasii]|nr:MAG: hypothetical protein EXX96DRAFT_556023 [Benjaminiella poitrasii]